MTRVLIVDANAQFRFALRRLIERDGDLTVVGEAGSLPDAVALGSRVAPDVALVDLALPGLEGARDLSPLEALGPTVGLVLLSLVDPQPPEDPRLDGVDYLLKSVPADEILTALRRHAPAEAAVGGR